ncbi:MAG: nuclear transport factor 2 family protein [Novosphingobium sp.]
MFARTFTEDVTADFGGAAIWPDRASLRQAFALIHAPFDATQHVTTSHHVTIDGERASFISYVHGRLIPARAGRRIDV